MCSPPPAPWTSHPLSASMLTAEARQTTAREEAMKDHIRRLPAVEKDVNENPMSYEIEMEKARAEARRAEAKERVNMWWSTATVMIVALLMAGWALPYWSPGYREKLRVRGNVATAELCVKYAPSKMRVPADELDARKQARRDDIAACVAALKGAE